MYVSRGGTTLLMGHGFFQVFESFLWTNEVSFVLQKATPLYYRASIKYRKFLMKNGFFSTRSRIQGNAKHLKTVALSGEMRKEVQEQQRLLRLSKNSLLLHTFFLLEDEISLFSFSEWTKWNLSNLITIKNQNFKHF